MVRLENLTKQDIQRLHEIVKPVIDSKTGKQARTPKGALKWRGLSKAGREFGVTRQTIANWLEEHPTPPERERPTKRMKPVKVQQFEKTKAWGFIKGDKFQSRIKNVLIQAWEYLDMIDPATWNANHYKALRKETHQGRENPLYIAATGDISPEDATNIRRFLDLARPPNKDEFKDILEDVPKRPTGTRKNWYIEAPDIIKLIPAISRLDVLMFTLVDIESGARPIAIAGGKESSGRELPLNLRYTKRSIDKDRNVIQRWENKKKKWARAKHQTEHIDLLERYIKDMGIGPDEMIFPFTPATYSNNLKKYGIKAGVARFSEKGAAAYVLRHTFTTQALSHNVSIEAVMEQGGWKTPDVIMQFYAGLKESKLDAEFLDKKPKDELTWKEWLTQFTPLFQEQYDKIIRSQLQQKAKKTEKPPLKYKAIRWGTVKAWANNPKVKNRQVYQKALKLHEQGLTDDEVRRRMKWRPYNK